MRTSVKLTWSMDWTGLDRRGSAA